VLLRSCIDSAMLERSSQYSLPKLRPQTNPPQKARMTWAELPETRSRVNGSFQDLRSSGHHRVCLSDLDSSVTSCGQRSGMLSSPARGRFARRKLRSMESLLIPLPFVSRHRPLIPVWLPRETARRQIRKVTRRELALDDLGAYTKSLPRRSWRSSGMVKVTGPPRPNWTRPLKRRRPMASARSRGRWSWSRRRRMRGSMAFMGP
jgi:hypothetical protein